jgi:hypothetical protein
LSINLFLLFALTFGLFLLFNIFLSLTIISPYFFLR